MAHATTDRPVVLLVEDDFLVRMPAAEIINAAGYDVVEALDADAAIMILKKHPDIQVLITDIEVSGSMDGLKLAHAVKHDWPPVHIIATSAYHASLENDLPAGSVFFPKPYTEHKIVGALHALTAFELAEKAEQQNAQGASRVGRRARGHVVGAARPNERTGAVRAAKGSPSSCEDRYVGGKTR
jgi:two-component system, response regulator PdtaR